MHDCRFYLNLRTDKKLIRDERGVVTSDIHAAIASVLIHSRELAKHAGAGRLDGCNLRWETTNEDGDTLAYVPCNGSRRGNVD